MIPKRIHYCWFGEKDLPDKAKKCIASWRNFCPDYQIVEWNQSNFDVYQNEYTRTMFEQKKFAFLSDYARLKIISLEGGIYFDVDVEVIKSFDALLNDCAFFGFETNEFVNTGIGFGAEAHAPIVEDMLREYDPLINSSGETIGCPILNTHALVKRGLVLDGTQQEINGAMIYPADFFNPFDDPTGCLNCTKNTYSIHWFAKSWMSPKLKCRSRIARPLHRLFGKDFWRYKK